MKFVWKSQIYSKSSIRIVYGGGESGGGGAAVRSAFIFCLQMASVTSSLFHLLAAAYRSP